MHFVHLINYTELGIKNIKDAPKRVEAAHEIAQKFGGEFKHIFYTMGKYDIVVISNFPNPESATKALLTLAGTGAIRTESMVSFTVDDLKNIVSDL